MFDKLLDIILQFGTHLIPFFVVPEYQNAGVMRLGKYNRTCLPGFHWKVPFADDVIPEDIFITTIRLQPQTLTTSDNKSIVLAAIVKYAVKDVQPYICLVGDQHDVIIDITMSTILTCVHEMTFEALLREPPENKVAISVRRTVKPFGIDIESIRFTDIGLIRSYRLITHTPAPHKVII